MADVRIIPSVDGNYTEVTLDDGHVVVFTWPVPKPRDAIRLAKEAAGITI